ncbi:hypothetical protein NDU88_002667 [Pleurodeles waltl]|uniref:Uncharacterized protein n=1 Tax=Pleurodeles waltl TaxID=8319 RepID=A0AAV7MS43_PLEWA|nr:hypothetical protein NDU88_002667 [Pleurodeles waltl]
MEKKVGANTEEDPEANKKEEEQDGDKQSGETIERREGWEPETARTKESCAEKEGRAKKEQTDAERSGRHGGARSIPGGTWLYQSPQVGGSGRKPRD